MVLYVIVLKKFEQLLLSNLYLMPHCFICRPLTFVSGNAGSEPRTVALFALHINLYFKLDICIGQFLQKVLLIKPGLFVLPWQIYDWCKTQLDNMCC
jgi:hypothetical protein